MIASVLPKKIKPCPMCGSKNITIYNLDYGYYSGYFIECKDCFLKGSKMFDLNPDFDEEKAVQTLINYWNNRPGQRPYTHDYNEEEVKALAAELKITEAQARCRIYQRAYQKKYREKNREKLQIYHKKWELMHTDANKKYYRNRIVAQVKKDNKDD